MNITKSWGGTSKAVSSVRTDPPNGGLPSPLAVETLTDEAEEYVRLAQEAGLQNLPAAQGMRLRQVVAELGLPIYPWDAVTTFLQKEAAKLGDQWRVNWHPLQVVLGWTVSVYDQPIPLRVLRRIHAVRTRLPEAQFYVSQLERAPKGDPFLAVGLPGMQWGTWLVIDHWDEPGFGFPVMP